MNNQLEQTLLETYGIDLSFDARFGLRGTKDVVAGEGDFAIATGPQALVQELQRLFDLTPLGSCIDDPTYGIDLDFIGTAINPPVTCGLVKVAALDALSHPSFAERFRVADLTATWSPDNPNAISIDGVLELYGFESIQLVRFGPYALRFLS